MTAASFPSLHAGDGNDQVLVPGGGGAAPAALDLDAQGQPCVTRPGDDYTAFVARVAAAQLAAWLPSAPVQLLDISASGAFGRQAAAAGHHVVQVQAPFGEDPREPAEEGAASPPGAPGGGRLCRVLGDARDLAWFRADSMDALVAEGSFLSSCLATEDTAAQAARILRPGGRLLVSVDSLVLGLARLAEQHRWPELADAPSADVVLVPNAQGTLVRCFGPEELRAVLAEAGLEVEWVRPRTVLPPEAIRRALADDPNRLGALVESELKLAIERAGESVGMYVLASARRPERG